MPRPKRDYAALHAAADRIEPRLARAFLRAAEKLRASISINDLAMAIAAKDVKAAMALLAPDAVKDALSPAAAITRDAVLRGGKLGADQVAKARVA